VALRDAGVSAERVLCGDTCELSELPSADFDAGLLLGPLYHLVDQSNKKSFFMVAAPSSFKLCHRGPRRELQSGAGVLGGPTKIPSRNGYS
jgi:hypothetical protein